MPSPPLVEGLRKLIYHFLLSSLKANRILEVGDRMASSEGYEHFVTCDHVFLSGS